MKKAFLIILSLFMLIPVFAGQYEDALRSGEPVILYIYTKECKYCKEFNPIFDALAQNYRKSYRFVKVDAYSPYGGLLIQDFRANYVPFVVLADARRQRLISIQPDCLLKNACVEEELKKFIK